MDLASAPLTELTTLCRKLRWIAPDTRLASGEPAGAGNMNHTLRVVLENRHAGEPASLVLKQSLPFVARFPEIAAPLERGQIEAAFYQCITSNPGLRERTPELLGFHAEHHLLCLQDLGSGSDLTGLYDPGEPTDIVNQQLQALTQWLTQLHGQPAPPGFPSNAAMRQLNHEHIFRVPFNTNEPVPVSAELAQLRAELAADDAFTQSVRRLGAIYLGESAGTSPPVLLHGDYYPGSWLHGPNGDVAIIDPEFGFVGPAEFDVGVMQAHLIFASFPASARRESLAGYRPPAAFDPDLMEQFAAVEVLRRLLGVAQLPLGASSIQQLQWARDAGQRLGARCG